MADCSSADSVLEAIALMKANGIKIDAFTNGTAAQTVQLGTGIPTPTLRKLVADSQAAVASVVASSTPVDAALSSTSTNPVQNKAVKAALDAITFATEEQIDALFA